MPHTLPENKVKITPNIEMGATKYGTSPINARKINAMETTIENRIKRPSFQKYNPFLWVVIRNEKIIKKDVVTERSILRQKEIDGGQLDMPELSMQEARSEILQDFEFDKKDLVVVDYDEVVERAEMMEAQKHKEIYAETSDSDLAYVLDKGVLVVGITDFAPMDSAAASLWRKRQR